MRSERFGLVLSPAEKQVLLRLAAGEHISAAAVVRRLIWSAAKHSDIKMCEVGSNTTPPQIKIDEEATP